MDPEISIEELASEWIDSYIENSDSAIKEIVNFVLKVSWLFSSFSYLL